MTRLTTDEAIAAARVVLNQCEETPRMIHIQDAKELVYLIDSLWWRLNEQKIATQAAYDFVRRTLETLTKTAGLPAHDEDGEPLRNYKLEENLSDWILRHED